MVGHAAATLGKAERKATIRGGGKGEGPFRIPEERHDLKVHNKSSNWSTYQRHYPSEAVWFGYSMLFVFVLLVDCEHTRCYALGWLCLCCAVLRRVVLCCADAN